MAWRPYDQLIEGELDNTVRGKVTGWMRFVGLKDTVTFDLDGDFHRDIRGAKVRLIGNNCADPEKSVSYMEGFSLVQKGNVGDMTAGLPPQDYVDYPYVEWYSAGVIELEPHQVQILTPPIPAQESDPISRRQQAENMAGFLNGLAEAVGLPQTHALAVGNTVAVERAKKVMANDKLRGMKLLPKEIRETLPALYSQDGKSGKAIVYTKYFTPDAQWSWYCTEGEPVLNDKGDEVDFRFFGLVDGFEKELGYFALSELEEVRGPMGLPIERDVYWQPKTLEQVAPELFSNP